MIIYLFKKCNIIKKHLDYTFSSRKHLDSQMYFAHTQFYNKSIIILPGEWIKYNCISYKINIKLHGKWIELYII